MDGRRQPEVLADTQVGNWDACYGTQTDGDNSASGALVNSGAGAIVVPEKEAYYTFTADIENMTYTWTKLDNQKQVSYSSLTLTGDFINWDEGGAGALKETTPNNWYAQITIRQTDKSNSAAATNGGEVPTTSARPTTAWPTAAKT